MNLETVLSAITNFAGTFNIQLIVSLFLLCCIGELAVVFVIPFALETVWLLAGYNVGAGLISWTDLFLLWLAAQAGRQAGASGLYLMGRLGTEAGKKIYQKYFSRNKLPAFMQNKESPVWKWVNKLHLSHLSPVTIALGRLSGMRVPLSLTLGANKQLGALELGVLLSSIVWDGIYIAFGMLGSRVVVKPSLMLVYSIGGLTLLYAVTLLVRYLRSRRRAGTALENLPEEADKRKG